MNREDYINWMYDRTNEYNCEDCPENIGAETGSCRQYPCGQQNCWVTCHCKQSEE